MANENIQKTTMIKKSKLFEWKVMPFGLKNATIFFLEQWQMCSRTGLTSFLKYLWMMSMSIVVIGGTI